MSDSRQVGMSKTAEFDREVAVIHESLLSDDLVVRHCTDMRGLALALAAHKVVFHPQYEDDQPEFVIVDRLRRLARWLTKAHGLAASLPPVTRQLLNELFLVAPAIYEVDAASSGEHVTPYREMLAAAVNAAEEYADQQLRAGWPARIDPAAGGMMASVARKRVGTLHTQLSNSLAILVDLPQSVEGGLSSQIQRIASLSHEVVFTRTAGLPTAVFSLAVCAFQYLNMRSGSRSGEIAEGVAATGRGLSNELHRYEGVFHSVMKYCPSVIPSADRASVCYSMTAKAVAICGYEIQDHRHLLAAAIKTMPKEIVQN